ncbi:hypothetical protein ACI65C_011608 [Semiaphis heraclei]
MADDLNLINAEVLQRSRVIPGLRGNSNVYIDHRGYSYYQHSVRRAIRYLTCSRRRYGCFATGQMQVEEGSTIHLSRHLHNHEPQPRHDEEIPWGSFGSWSSSSNADFEQGLRNAINRVIPEATNTGCWFHYIRLMALPHLPASAIDYHQNRFSIQLGFRFIQDLVRDYELEAELRGLLTYFERFWLDVVGPSNFSVHRLRYRTNNFIESYHATLVRLMGQHPPLYRFYEHLRGIEERSRADFIRAVNGQPVRRVEYRGNTRPRNDIIINTAWERCENGIYNLEDFIRNVSHTPEQLLRNEIGEPNFIERPVVLPVAPIQPLAPPPLLPARPIPQIRAMPQPALAALPPPRPVAIRQPIQPPQLPIQPILPQAVQQIPPVPVRRDGHAPRGGRGPGQVQVREQNAQRGWEAFFHEIEDEAYEEEQEQEQEQDDCIICYDRPSTVLEVS